MHEAYLLFIIVLATLLLFISNYWRYDIVAAFSLLVCVLINIVPPNNAFLGFSNPAVITVASVMIITQGITRSGFVDYLVKKLTHFTAHPISHVASLTFIAAILSAFMNNIGALALLLPVAIKTSIQQKRSPSLVLMPLAFGSVLGGLTTLIGTPPNILIANFREESLGQSFSMFDFSPVGIVVAFIGCLFISVIGWRLIPARQQVPRDEDVFQIGDYITEIQIPEKSSIVGKTVRELERLTDGDITILGLIRNKRKRLVIPSTELLQESDILIIEASHKDLDKLILAGKLDLVEGETISSEILRSDNIQLIEAVVPPDSRMEGRSSQSMRLRSRFGLNLIAISRQGKAFKERLKEVRLCAGDVALLQGDSETLRENIVSLGMLPLVERGVSIGKPSKAFLTFFLFISAILLAAFRVFPIYITFPGCVVGYVIFKILPARNIYESIDWPIIVLLGCMIPIGHALQTTGGTEIIANGILQLAGTFSPIFVLAILLILCMTLSDVMNNAATAVVMAPIAVSIAQAMHYNIDPFLMTVAVGASCSFLTPIGHQNNTLVMGPGGYHFIDYPKLGIWIELLVLLVGLPVILYFWPLS